MFARLCPRPPLAFLAPSSARADVKPHSLLHRWHGAQQQMTVTLGHADKGEKVTIAFPRQKPASAAADEPRPLEGIARSRRRGRAISDDDRR